MSANIFIHEFRMRLKSLLIWSLSLTALLFFYYSIFPTFSDQAALTKIMLAKFPPQLLEAFGMNRMDLSTVLGYSAFIFVFVQLCLAIQAGNYGFGLVSIEENELTADFLLSKPISRGRVIVTKFLAALSILLLTVLVVGVVSFGSILIFRENHEYDPGLLLLLVFSLPILQLFFISVGLAVSLLVKRVRSVTPYSLGLGFGAYVLNAFSGVFGDIKLEYITPFRHLDPAAIVANKGYDIPLVLLNVAITVIALGVSYWLYIRRDIPAVS
jgi:ABC-2 type transport system permease protein